MHTTAWFHFHHFCFLFLRATLSCAKSALCSTLATSLKSPFLAPSHSPRTSVYQLLRTSPQNQNQNLVYRTTEPAPAPVTPAPRTTEPQNHSLLVSLCLPLFPHSACQVQDKENEATRKNGERTHST